MCNEKTATFIDYLNIFYSSTVSKTNSYSFYPTFAAGSLAGALGSIVGNPFDVLKTRMMTAEGE